MDEYESVLLVKPEVFVYKIPPRTTNRGYRASDWKLESPDWTGKMQVVAKGKNCIIKLLDKNTGELFSKSPIDKYPGVALEAVMDSSRYFVLRIESDNGQSAFIGIGFADRGDSFDLNVALQDHFKWLQKSEEIEQETASDKPGLDLGFKDGQTITINMNLAKKAGNSAKPRPKPMSAGATPGFLPPPPSGIKLPPPSTRVGSQSASTTRENPLNNQSSGSDFLVDFAFASPASTPDVPSTTSESQSFTGNDLWGDFAAAAAAPANSSQTSQSSSSKNWIDF